MQLPPASPFPSNTPNQGGNRRTQMLLIGGGVIALIAIAVGVAVLAFTLLGRRPNSIPQLLAGDTQIYAAITPNLSDLPNIDRLRKAFPETIDYQNNITTTNQLRDLLGVDFKTDIAPWIGTEVAVAVSGLPFDTLFDPRSASLAGDTSQIEKAKVTLVFTSRDEKAAQAFLDKQRKYREGKGQQFASSQAQDSTIYAQQGGTPSPITAFGIVRGNVIFATSADLITAIAARDPNGKDTLAASPRFQQVLAALPAGHIGFVFVDGVPLSNAVSANTEKIVGQIQGTTADRLREQLKSAAALQGVGLSISILADGVAFDALVQVDRAKLSQATLDQIKETADPVSADRVGRISSDALSALSFRLPASLGQQISDAIASTPGAAEQVASVEKQFDLDLKRDLLSWLQGEATIVLMPGEDVVGTPAPVTGYFALKTNNKAAAQDGLKRITTAIDTAGGGMLALREEQLGGVAWQVIGPSQQVVVGYAFIGDDLVIGVGPKTLTAAASPKAPLSGNPAYQVGLKAVPAPNAGLIFVNVPSIVSLSQQMGAFSDLTVADRLKPFKAITAAGAPGIDEKGVAHGRLYLVITGE
ncbi:MAG: DUF3352 domain-containing protein [Chloroflexales bacterium]